MAEQLPSGELGESQPAGLLEECRRWEEILNTVSDSEREGISSQAIAALNTHTSIEGHDIIFWGLSYMPYFDEAGEPAGLGPIDLQDPLNGVSQGFTVLISTDPETRAAEWIIAHKILFPSKVCESGQDDNEVELTYEQAFLDIEGARYVDVSEVDDIYAPKQDSSSDIIDAVYAVLDSYSADSQQGKFKQKSSADKQAFMNKLIESCETGLALNGARLELISRDAYVLQGIGSNQVRLKAVQILRRAQIVTFLGIEAFERLAPGLPLSKKQLAHHGPCMVVDLVEDRSEEGIDVSQVLYVPLIDNAFNYDFYQPEE